MGCGTIPPSMKLPNVLIVDSDPGDLAKHAAILEEGRYTVLQATTVAEAATILGRHRGKLVVLSELSAGKESGHDFLKDTLKKYPFLPFTFISASPPLKSVLGALRQGAYDFLRKPVPPDILLHSVARSVQRLNLMIETEKQEKEIRKLLDRSREELNDLQTLSSFKGFMISMAAHDFRSIIGVLDAYMQFIRDKCTGCEITGPAGLAHQASRTMERLRTMANTLLDYQAAEKGRIQLDVKPFPLGEALRDCADFYRPYAEQKGITLVLDGDDPGTLILGDRAKVMEILDNILYNALKFTPANGEIRLGSSMRDGSANISVRDSGAGIPKEKLRALFDPSKMVATLDSHARLGIGLTICKKLVEIQKGKLWIESTPGKGTKVSLSLPVSGNNMPIK